jgi:trimethylamine:corrinoid methyltransferase-like protein
LETEHTAHRFRSLGWYPRLFDRTYCEHTQPAPVDDSLLLRQADEAWRKLVAAEEPVEVDAVFSAELDRIVAAARKELLVD